jgi:hypothetical protein
MKLVRTPEFKILLYLIVVGIFMLAFRVSPTLDIKFYYTVPEAKDLLTSLSVADTNNYGIHELFDILYLIGYGMLSFALMLRVSSHSILLWFSILPSVMDLIETVTILGVLHESICVPGWLGFVTALKWTLGGVVVVVLVVGYFRGGYEKVSGD